MHYCPYCNQDTMGNHEHHCPNKQQNIGSTYFYTNPNRLKLETLSKMQLLPNEGETFDICGGRGNKILKQVKKEDGKYYERNNVDDEWTPFDLLTAWNRLKNMLGIDI